MASSDSQIDKPQPGRPKRAELPDANVNTGTQSIDTERASLSITFAVESTSASLEWSQVCDSFIINYSFKTLTLYNVAAKFCEFIVGAKKPVNEPKW